MKIYIVMETVDLGGNTVCAFLNETDANEHKTRLNQIFMANKKVGLIKGCNYTEEAADQAVKSCFNNQFYIEECELVDWQIRNGDYHKCKQ